MAGDRGYFGSFNIPTPKGIYQAAGDTNVNADYAYRAENIRTEYEKKFAAMGKPIYRLEAYLK